MSGGNNSTIRSLFSARRPIDRPIEKVIDYYATDDSRLLAEVEEYEVTENVERNIRRFLEVFGAGVRTSQVAETGIWVSGFYGSGKSSFTKYLGFALDPSRTIAGRRFYELLCERIEAVDVRQDLKVLATQQPTAVVMLDLGAEQLASSPSTTVSTVLYWKVLQWAGYSKEEKLAHLEFRLDQEGRLAAFKEAYRALFDGNWDDVHDDPLLGVSRADKIVSQFYPDDFAEPGSFSRLRFSLAGDVRERAREILGLIRRKTGRENVIFLVDEAGQYVAPRRELILNLDGLVRSFKEIGRGRVWVVATGQQTLAEIVERAAMNSQELNRLRDRFPISIELDARDIREITWRRLLSKSADGEAALTALFRQHGQALAANSRLTGTSLFKGDPDEQSFVRLYPFLPHHFDLLLELVRTLARSTGGIGLRSAIRVIQDLLVDTSRVLPAGAILLADRPVGRLVTVDQFFDTLRADIMKVLPHVVAGVDRAAKALPGDELALRVAKAIGALQPIESLPRTAENVAALLYQQIGEAPQIDDVRAALGRLTGEKEVGLVDDPQAGGFTFLSEGVKPIRDKRNAYVPTRADLSLLRSQILMGLFDPLPSASLEGTKTVKAGVSVGRAPIAGEGEEVQFRLEITDGASREERRTTLLTETIGEPEWKTAIAWLIQPDEGIDDLLVEVIRSRRVIQEMPESEADRDVAQFIRAERRAAETYEDRARSAYRKALLEGTFIFRGKPTPASVAGSTLEAAAKAVLEVAAGEIYRSYHLVGFRASTDLAARFLGIDRLDHMPRDADPLGFVATQSGRPRVNIQHLALSEALRAFHERLEQNGTGRLQGNAIQDLFAAPPYGWSKDATRYVFAALLLAGEIVLHTANGEVRTASPGAIAAFQSTHAFGRVGIAIRDISTRPTNEALERAASRLEDLFGITVLTTEEQISRAARDRLPSRLEKIAPLSAQLQLLDLPGADRAQSLVDSGHDLVQEDGVGVIAVLGTDSCAFPADLRWAEAASAALANGADRDIRAARDAVRQASELMRLYPTAARGLVTEADCETLEDVLASDEFYTRLADLRGIVRTIADRARVSYLGHRTAYDDGLAQARARLESVPEWVQLSDEDRAELGQRLVTELPETPRSGMELEQLNLLLARSIALAALERELMRELVGRVPRDPGVSDEVVLDMTEFLPAQPLKDEADLAAWLERLRSAIKAAMVGDRYVQLKVRR